jgi:hypothetical protein
MSPPPPPPPCRILDQYEISLIFHQKNQRLSILYQNPNLDLQSVQMIGCRCYSCCDDVFQFQWKGSQMTGAESEIM